jgi:hypothetical protein
MPVYIVALKAAAGKVRSSKDGQRASPLKIHIWFLCSKDANFTKGICSISTVGVLARNTYEETSTFKNRDK